MIVTLISFVIILILLFLINVLIPTGTLQYKTKLIGITAILSFILMSNQGKRLALGFWWSALTVFIVYMASLYGTPVNVFWFKLAWYCAMWYVYFRVYKFKSIYPIVLTLVVLTFYPYLLNGKNL